MTHRIPSVTTPIPLGIPRPPQQPIPQTMWIFAPQAGNFPSFPSAFLPTPEYNSSQAAKAEAIAKEHLQRVPQKEVEIEKTLKLMNKGEFEQAHLVIGQFLIWNPLHFEARRVQSLLLWRENRLDEALNYITFALEVHPFNSRGYFLRGAVHLQKHDYLAALKDFKMGFTSQMSKSISFEYTLLFDCKYSFDTTKETALFYLERSIQLHPEAVEDLILLRAIFYSTQFDHTSAIRDITFVAQNPGNLFAHAVKRAILNRAERLSHVANQKPLSLLQGKIPIEFLLNKESS